MKRLIGLVVVLGCLALPQSGWAQVLTFEGLQDQEQIEQFYNGGPGSLGSVGPDFNIEFGSDALALIDADAGGNGNFANEPSPDTIAFFLSGPGVIMNVPNGFQNGFSFFYSAQGAASVEVYDGLNASGNVLATLILVENYQNGACVGDPTGSFCHWDPVGVTFAGTARSVSFSGAANLVGFDDVTLGSDIPGDTGGDRCKVTNGANFTAANGDKATAGGNAQAVSSSVATGSEEYTDHGPATPFKFKSTQINGVTCSSDRKQATILGDGLVNNSQPVSFQIDVTDNGEPGKSDTYRIQLSNGYDSGERTLKGGNTQIHK